MTSIARTGVAISISMVPRSVSFTMATAVIITMVMGNMMARSPGTMLVEVRPSGLYIFCTETPNGAGAGASPASGQMLK